MSGVYRAYYTDAAKVERMAIERGYSGQEGESWFDYVEADHSRYWTSQTFGDLEKAVKWIGSAVIEGKTCFSGGTILLEEKTHSRCKSCACEGKWTTHEYSVDETGIVDEMELSPPCQEEVE